jgi:hypothetical protein
MAIDLRKLVVVVGAVAALGGCMMGPDYVRPKFDTPAAFRFEPKDVSDTASTAWWKQFGDPVLDSLIAEALANNVNLKVAVANVEQAAGVFSQTRSQLFPQIGYSATGERARTTQAGATRKSYVCCQTLKPHIRRADRELGSTSGDASAGKANRRWANVLASDDAPRRHSFAGRCGGQ